MTRLQNYITDSELNQIFEGTLNDLENIDLNEIYSVPDTEQEKIDESISAVFIISIIIALPSLFKTIVKTFGFFYKKIKKLFGGKEESSVEQKLVEFSNKWHRVYVKILRRILKTGGVFKAAGIKDKNKQITATEVVYYTIIFGLAIYGGVATVKGILTILKDTAAISSIKMVTLEGVLTSIKTKEITSFIQKITRA